MGFSFDNVMVGATALIVLAFIVFVACGFVAITGWELQKLIEGDEWFGNKTHWLYYVIGPVLGAFVIVSLLAFCNWIGSLIH